MRIGSRSFLLPACAAMLTVSASASAQNIALNKPVSATAGVVNSSGNPNRITDGVYNGHGSYWQSNSMWWNGTQQNVTVYLGGSYTISGFTVEADNNDTYLMEFSNDLGATWAPAWSVPVGCCGGMDNRSTTLGSAITANELRFSATGGDNSYSISQLEAIGTAAVVATPEPATLGLMTLGLIGLVPVARSRRRR